MNTTPEISVQIPVSPKRPCMVIGGQLVYTAVHACVFGCLEGGCEVSSQWIDLASSAVSTDELGRGAEKCGIHPSDYRTPSSTASSISSECTEIQENRQRPVLIGRRRTAAIRKPLQSARSYRVVGQLSKRCDFEIAIEAASMNTELPTLYEQRPPTFLCFRFLAAVFLLAVKRT